MLAEGSHLPSPWNFHWHRAKGGYDLVRTKGGSEDLVLRMRDARAGWVSYADRSEQQQLANLRGIEFIDLGRVHIELAEVQYRTPKLAVESVLPFVNKYGLPFAGLQRECSLADLIRLQKFVSSMIKNAEHPRLSDEEVAMASVHGHRYSKDEVRGMIAERVTMEHPINGALQLVSTPQGLAMRFQPNTLEDFIWLQVAREFHRELVHKQCHCGTWFTVRNDKRELRRYACTDRCKKALQRKLKKESTS